MDVGTFNHCYSKPLGKAAYFRRPICHSALKQTAGRDGDRESWGCAEGSAGRERVVWIGELTGSGLCGGVSRQEEGHVEGSAGRFFLYFFFISLFRLKHHQIHFWFSLRFQYNEVEHINNRYLTEQFKYNNNNNNNSNKVMIVKVVMIKINNKDK